MRNFLFRRKNRTDRRENIGLIRIPVRFPENLILSHDLVESSFTRSAFVTGFADLCVNQAARLPQNIELYVNDGKTGRVTYQTPSTVQIIEADGALTVYQTPAFLALNPRNASTNLRVTSTFGVDHKHQAVCTTQIPEVMLESLKRELPKIVDSASILDVKVLFKAAGSSSTRVPAVVLIRRPVWSAYRL